MTKISEDEVKDFRSEAEQAVDKLSALSGTCKGDTETQRQFHELHVHKVELEMQNEELNVSIDELLQSRERYRAMVNAFDGLMYICSKDYRIEFMSDATIQRTGRDATGEYCYKSLHDLDAVCEWCQNEKVFKGESVQWEVKSPKDGRWYEASNTPVYNTDGSISKQALITDITSRKTSELALEESEHRFRSIVEHTPNIVMIHVDNKFVYLNPSAVEAFGITDQQEYIGKQIMEVVHPDFHNIVRERVDRAANNNQFNQKNEEQLLRKDGSPFWVEITGIPFTHQGNKAVLVIGVDITKRKRAEEDLKVSEEQFRNIVNKSPWAILLYDLMPDGKLVFTRANPAADRIMGVDSSQFIGNTIEQAFPSLADTAIPAQYKETALKGTQWREKSLAYSDGVISGVYENIAFQTEPGKMAVMFDDITERRNNEQALQKMKDLHAETEKFSKTGGWEFDINTRESVWTEEVYRIHELDFDFKPTVDKGIDFYTPESRPIIEKAVQRAIEYGESFDVELDIVTAKGTPKTIHAFGKPELEQHKIVGMFQDVTDRKNAETEKLLLEQQFQQAQRLESLGVLAGGIAHDFNNILAIIMGNACLAKRNPENITDKLTAIEKASERAAGLCRQMLAYAGKSQFVEDKVNIDAQVSETVKLLKASLPQNVAIRYTSLPDIPSIKADAGQISQVATSLIINATEALGDAQGEVIVTLATTEIKAAQSEKDYFGKFIPPGWYACLEVSDNGCGISEENYNRIFEPFYTTKFVGRGLSLSAVLGIIQSHKGSLQLFSEPGRGTTFKVFLPVQVTVPAENHPHVQTAQPSEWRGSGTILLVEDEDQVRFIAKAMLEYLGFNVMEAVNGKEGLEIYQNNASEITLVVTDMGMPVMDGYELCRELKKIDPKLPLIISSGFSDEDVVSRLGNHGIAGLISKPYTSDKLREVLKVVVEGALSAHV
ncbi:MAG: PAS domain S-box protein [Desulfuromonadaceae bacterium]|nr:PAS domain S-box protein [Desulfuromonadaceae bacterium]